MYKNINLFRNTGKKTEQQPDYKISVSEKLADGTFKNKEAGACWLKPMKDGGKYMSCQLKDAREHEGIQYAGFNLVEDNGGAPVRAPEQVEQTNDEDIPF